VGKYKSCFRTYFHISTLLSRVTYLV